MTGTETVPTTARWAARRYASDDAASRKRSTASAGSVLRVGAGFRRCGAYCGASSGRTAVVPPEPTSRAHAATDAGSGRSTGTGTSSKSTVPDGRSGSSTVHVPLAAAA